MDGELEKLVGGWKSPGFANAAKSRGFGRSQPLIKFFEATDRSSGPHFH